MVPAAVQTSPCTARCSGLVERGTLWFLRNGGSPLDISVNIVAFDQAVGALAQRLETMLPERCDRRMSTPRASGGRRGACRRSWRGASPG